MVKKKILLTGADGYIGSVLGPKLAEQGYQLTGWDSFFFKSNQLEKFSPAYPIKKIDLRSIQDHSLANFQAIIHLAAIANDPTEKLDPRLTENINYKATIDLAKKAKREGVNTFLFTSTCSVYGFNHQGPVTEKSTPNPLTSYAKAKINAEKELVKLADKDFTVIILRNATLYGAAPKYRNDLVINNFTAGGLINKRIEIKSDGTPWRAYVDIRDVAKIISLFLKAKKEKVNGQIFNVGFNENNLRVKDILQIVQSVLAECEVVYTNEHQGDTRSYRVNFDKLSGLFPALKQDWPIERSIRDLVVRLKKAGFSKNDLATRKFERVAYLAQTI